MPSDKKQNSNYVRPGWDEYFMKMVNVIAERGTCDRGRTGCVITKNNHILATGYVGSPKGLPHCDEVGHEMQSVINDEGKETQHCVRTVHFEQNAIATAARVGIALDGSTLYCMMTPCYTCAKILVNAGIKRVVCAKDYHAGEKSKRVFREAGIKYELLDSEIVTYDNM